MSATSCPKCGRPVDPTEPHFDEVIGWARPGKGAHGKSGSSLVLREPTGRIAHRECVTAETHGISVEQMTLHEYGLVEPGIEP